MRKFIIIFGTAILALTTSNAWADIWNCEVEVSNTDNSDPCMLGNPAAIENAFKELKHDKKGKTFTDYNSYYKPCEDLGTIIAKIKSDNVCAVGGDNWNIISFKTSGVTSAYPKNTANGLTEDDFEGFWEKYSGFNGGELNIEKTVSVDTQGRVIDLHGLNWFLDNDADDICWGDPNDDGNCNKDAWGKGEDCHWHHRAYYTYWYYHCHDDRVDLDYAGSNSRTGKDIKRSGDGVVDGGWRKAIVQNIFPKSTSEILISFWKMGDDGDVAFFAGDRNACPEDKPCGSYSKIEISSEISGPAFIVSSEFIIRDVLIKANGPIAKVEKGGSLILSNIFIDATEYTGSEPLIEVKPGGLVYFKDIYNEQPDFDPQTRVLLPSKGAPFVTFQEPHVTATGGDLTTLYDQEPDSIGRAIFVSQREPNQPIFDVENKDPIQCVLKPNETTRCIYDCQYKGYDEKGWIIVPQGNGLEVKVALQPKNEGDKCAFDWNTELVGQSKEKDENIYDATYYQKVNIYYNNEVFKIVACEEGTNLVLGENGTWRCMSQGEDGWAAKHGGWTYDAATSKLVCGGWTYDGEDYAHDAVSTDPAVVDLDGNCLIDGCKFGKIFHNFEDEYGRGTCDYEKPECDEGQELHQKLSGMYICIAKCDAGKGFINLAALDGATDKCVCKDDGKVLIDGVCTQSKLSQCKQHEKFNKETNECVLECPSEKFANKVARTCDVKKTCDVALQKYVYATNACDCIYEGAEAESCMCPSGTKQGVDIAGGFVKKCMPVETKETSAGKNVNGQECGAHQYFEGECMCEDGYIAIVGSKPLECEVSPAASCSGYLDASSGLCIPKLDTTTPATPSTPSTATAVNGALLTGPRGGCMSVGGATTLPQGAANILPYLLVLLATRLRKKIF